MLRAVEAIGWPIVAVLLLAIPDFTPGEQEGPARDIRTWPELQEGEWWRIVVRDNRGNESVQGTVVLTGVHRDSLDFGVGFDSLHPMLLNYHVMPPGTAARDLSYEVHGETFHPVAFPLERGQEWHTQFGGLPIAAKVVDSNGETARIEYVKPNGDLYGEATFDARIGWLSELKFGRYDAGPDPNSDAYWVHANVVEHGFHYGCESVQPQHLQIFDIEYGAEDATPIKADSFIVPQAATHVAVSMSVGAASGHPDGWARQQLIGPDGTVYQVNSDPGQGYQHQFIVKTQPQGAWTSFTERFSGGFASTTASTFTAKQVSPFGPAAPGTDSCVPLAGPAAATQVPVHSNGIMDQAWRLAALVGLAAARFWRRIGWAAVGLFSRIDREPVADQPMRRRMLELLAGAEGLSTQEIKKRLGIGWGTTVHHLATLERHGWAVRSHTGRRVYWTVPGGRLAPNEPGTRALVLAAIRSNPGVGPSRLAELLGIRHSTAIYHVRLLAKSGKVTVEHDGRLRRYYA